MSTIECSKTNWNYKIITQRNWEGLGRGVKPGGESEKGSWKGAITHVKVKITGLMNGQRCTETDFSSKHELLIITPIKIWNGLLKEVFPITGDEKAQTAQSTWEGYCRQTECRRRRKTRHLPELYIRGPKISILLQTTIAPAPTNTAKRRARKKRCDSLTLTVNSEYTSWENKATETEEFTKSILSHR